MQKLKIKITITKNSFDAFIICIMLYYVLFGIWIGTGVDITQKVIVGLCIARVLFYSFKKNNPYGKLVLYTVLLALFFCFNFVAYSDNRFFKDNMSYIINCWSVVIYFAVLLQTERSWLEQFLVKISRLINLYMCMNIVVMFLQLNESYFLIDRSRIPSVVYYPDYIAGFFGINGTHRLTLFCIFFICLNMIVFRFKLVESYRRIPPFVAVMSVCLFIISTQNDNNTFFILYPLFALFLYAILYTIDYKRLGKICFFVLGIILLIVVVVSTNNTLFQEIGDRLNDIIQVYFFGNKNVWDERSELLTYALVHGKGYLLGSGIGSVKMYSDKSISMHWGMNSLMTFTYFMGIIPLVFYAAAHIMMLTNSFERYVLKTKLIIRAGMLVLIMLLIQYCQILSEINLMILFVLICSVFVLAVDKVESEKRKTNL